MTGQGKRMTGRGKMRGGRLANFARRWGGDSQGAAAVEFALVLPVIILLYLGAFETSQAVAAYRKLSDLTTELANVASQYASYTKSDLDSINAASAQVMAPFSITNLTVTTTEFTTDPAAGSGTGTVIGSRRLAADVTSSPYLATQAISGLPKSLAGSTTYIWIQSSYNYQLTVGAKVIAAIPTMSDQLFILPRTVSPIPCPDCT